MVSISVGLAAGSGGVVPFAVQTDGSNAVLTVKAGTTAADLD